MKIRSTIIIGLVSLGLRAGDGYLYTRYLQAQVIYQVYAQQAQLTDGLTASTAAEVGDAFDQWRKTTARNPASRPGEGTGRGGKVRVFRIYTALSRRKERRG